MVYENLGIFFDFKYGIKYPRITTYKAMQYNKKSNIAAKTKINIVDKYRIGL